jgi:hypothetical protein
MVKKLVAFLVFIVMSQLLFGCGVPVVDQETRGVFYSKVLRKPHVSIVIVGGKRNYQDLKLQIGYNFHSPDPNQKLKVHMIAKVKTPKEKNYVVIKEGDLWFDQGNFDYTLEFKIPSRYANKEIVFNLTLIPDEEVFKEKTKDYTLNEEIVLLPKSEKTPTKHVW